MVETRLALQRVAAHVMARARHRATGKFGLRATPGGFGTPAFGADIEVLRVAGPMLVRENGGRATTISLDGATLATLANFAGVDLSEPFDVGNDTPPLGHVDAPLAIDADDTGVLADWWHLGWRALDTVSAAADADATAIQLWPEHFDAGCSISYGPGPNDRCNLGASPGDASSDEPYLYVGPWSDARPGDDRYWNAPFGAVARRGDITSREDAVAFLTRGIELLRVSTRTAPL